MVSHAGQFLYQFTRSLNWLEFDPIYPNNPSNLGEYIRKWRMEQGLSQILLAERLGVNKITLLKWEIKGRIPAKRHMERLRRAIPGLAAIIQDSYQKIAG